MPWLLLKRCRSKRALQHRGDGMSEYMYMYMYNIYMFMFMFMYMCMYMYMYMYARAEHASER